MNRAVSAPALERFAELLAARVGLYFPPPRWPDLLRGVGKVADELGFPSADSCLHALLDAPLDRGRIEVLARHLSIGETYFFRDPAVFAALEKEVLPPLIAARRATDRHLRIWSAGCSTGEEAYSVAILLMRLIPDIAAWNVRLVGTDINPRVLARAKHGVYRDWSFRGVPAWLRRDYFHKTAEGYRLSGEVRKRVGFSYLNLVEDGYPSVTTNTNAIDILLCRNVLMYFDAPTVEAVAQRLNRAVVDGGWLIVSATEAGAARFPGFTTVRIGDAILYRKDGARPPAPARAAAASSPPVAAPVPLAPASALGPAAIPTPASAAAAARDAAYRDGLARFERGDYAGARDAMRSGGPTDARSLALLGRACANLGELDDACRWCDAAVAADKLDAGLRYLLATVLDEAGRPRDAADVLRQALYLDPDHVLAHFALGNLQRRLGRPLRAAKQFATARRLLAGYPPDAQPADAEGLTAARLRDIIDATEGIA